MIDTIKLNLRDCSIKNNSQMIIQPSSYNHFTQKKSNEFDLFITDTGKIITGQKAYLNTDKFNVTIQPSVECLKDAETIQLKKKRFKRMVPNKNFWDYNEFENESDEVNGIFVSVSIPRLKSQNNFKSLSVNDEKDYLKYLESELRKVGIKTNIWSSELSRIDTFVNLNTEHSFYNYTPLFNLMECSRKKAVEWNGETFLWKNGEQQLMCYDKMTEMKNKNKKFKLPGTNIVRIENRYLKKRKIKTVFGFTKLDDLYKNYDVLKDNYKKEISNNIFKYDLPSIDLLTNDSIKNEMLIVKKIYNGRNWFQKYLMLKGVQSIIKSTDINSIFEVFESLESRSGIGMKKTRLKKMITEMKMILPGNNQFSYKTNRELYDELKSKFYKEVA